MKYTREERLVIGQRIYEGELNRNTAARLYNIGICTARDYMRYYRDIHGLPPKYVPQRQAEKTADEKQTYTFEEMLKMDKEELVDELIMAKINEMRMLKGMPIEAEKKTRAQRQIEYQIIMELADYFPVKRLCKMMGILQASYYAWKRKL